MPDQIPMQRDRPKPTTRKPSKQQLDRSNRPDTSSSSIITSTNMPEG
jgi:hypothetical protein